MLLQFFYRLFRGIGGRAIRIRFSYDDANELSAARTENIHVRAAFAFTQLIPAYRAGRIHFHDFIVVSEMNI